MIKSLLKRNESKEKLINSNKNTNIKSYNVHITLTTTKIEYQNSHCLIEKENLKDLSASLIKELTINTGTVVNLNYKSKFHLSKLLVNPNIKKLILNISNTSFKEAVKCSSNFLIYLSSLINKNNTIKQIDLSLKSYTTKRLPLHRTVYLYFFQSIASRLSRLHTNHNFFFNEEVIKSCFCNNELIREIEINNPSKFFNYSNIIKYLTTSPKCFLNSLNIYSGYINYLVLEEILSSKDRSEIKKLIVKETDYVFIEKIIKNAYLFKVEELVVDCKSIDNKSLSENIITSIFELSNNILNTVRNVTLLGFDININEIKEKLNIKDYDNNKIPQIYISSLEKTDNLENNSLKPISSSISPEITDDTSDNSVYDRIFNMHDDIDYKFSLEWNKDKLFIINQLFDTLLTHSYLESIDICLIESNKGNNISTNKENNEISNKITKTNILECYDKVKTRINNDRINKNLLTIASLSLKYLESDSSNESKSYFFNLVEIIFKMSVKIENLEIKNFSVIDFVSFLSSNSTKTIKIKSLTIIMREEEYNIESIKKLYSLKGLIEDEIILYLDHKVISDYKEEAVKMMKYIKQQNSNFIVVEITGNLNNNDLDYILYVPKEKSFKLEYKNKDINECDEVTALCNEMKKITNENKDIQIDIENLTLVDLNIEKDRNFAILETSNNTTTNQETNTQFEFNSLKLFFSFIKSLKKTNEGIINIHNIFYRSDSISKNDKNMEETIFDVIDVFNKISNKDSINPMSYTFNNYVIVSNTRNFRLKKRIKRYIRNHKFICE